MDKEGPLLETLTHRLAICPPEFLMEPVIGAAGVIHTAAVVSDLLVAAGGEPLYAALAEPFIVDGGQPEQVAQHRSRLQLTLIACWLFADEWFLRQEGRYAVPIYRFLAGGLAATAGLVAARSFVEDPIHREELARLALAGCGLRPAGETAEQAQDRLSTLDSVERQRVLDAARRSEERSRAVREAMASKAAQDAAARWNRE